MTNAIVPVEANLSVLAIQGAISKEDIVDIGVAKLERKLIAAEKEAVKNWKECLQVSALAVKALDKCLKSLAKQKFGIHINCVNDAVKALDGNCELLSIGNVEFFDNTTEKGKDVSVTFLFKGQHQSLIPHATIKPDDAVLNARKIIVKATEAVDKSKNELQVIREKMSQMARLERQLRASLAEAELNTTEKGANLVTLIDRSTDEFMKSL